MRGWIQSLRHWWEMQRTARPYLLRLQRLSGAMQAERRLARRELEGLLLEALLRAQRAGTGGTVPAVPGPARPGPGISRVMAHLAAHPEDAGLSNRVLGERLGLSHMTVSRARRWNG